MEKLTKQQSDKIKRINVKLIERFDIPYRAEIPPSPLDMLIATILSQNTNDKNSYQAYIKLREAFPDWRKILDTPREEIEDIIRIAGLGKQKSAAIKNLISFINENYDEMSLDFVKDFDDRRLLDTLTALPGIGLKTASCVLLFALERDVCPVDTHVHRTLNRLGLVKTSSPDKTFLAINGNFPQGIAHSLHTNLIRLGRAICKPQNPACGVCPLLRMCKYENKVTSNKSEYSENGFMLLDNVRQ
ncbi:MAG: endonuclease III [Melioribacteraceae bacterium]|nr:MAG: endonuclease III [Melioribacteraceae bacterium]